MGNIRDATKLFKVACEAEPSDAHSWNAWATALAQRGNVDGARKVFSDALQACPTSVYLWTGLAELEHSTASYPQALETIETALERCKDQNVSPLHYTRGKIQRTTGDKDGALRSFQAAVEHDASHAQSWLAMVDLRVRGAGPAEKGRPDNDIRMAFRDAVSHVPEDSHLLHSYAHYERQVGNRKKFRRLLERAVALDRANVAAFSDLMLDKLDRDVPGALKDIEDRLAELRNGTGPVSVSIHSLHGRALAKMKRWAAAHSAFERAIWMSTAAYGEADPHALWQYTTSVLIPTRKWSRAEQVCVDALDSRRLGSIHREPSA